MLKQLTPIIDSRKVISPKDSLFFAIDGDRNNGHNYITKLYNDGVRNFVIEDPDFNISSFENATFELVDSSIYAFQKYVQNIREQFNIPVIGVTGSNGKTIVKEWLSELLDDNEVVIKSPRS